jgi:hypothetical protein
MPVPDLPKHLEKLNELVDPAHARNVERLVTDAHAYREVERLPVINTTPVEGWPTYPYSEAFYDMEKMLVNELAGVYAGAKLRDDRIYTIRANYGVGTVASMFGCSVSLTENNMPWFEALPEKELLEALEKGVPEVTSGLAGRVLETERFYLETLAQYPNLAKAVHVFLCDTQGPFDTSHIVMGHRIYTDIYDNPDLIHRVLALVTDTYIAFTKAQKQVTGEGNDWTFHTMARVRGGTRICEDSPINISGAAYQEFCRPYNERAFAEFGGGWIHYCGKGYQIFPHVISIPGLTGINFGNPDLQDLQGVYDESSRRGVAIISWGGPFTEADAKCIKTGISLMQAVG